jgi:hypothetical protein
LQARSSSGDPYTVSFKLEARVLTIGCECQAAGFGLACKHRLALAGADSRMLYDPAQKEELETAVSWAQSSDLVTLLDKVENAERAVEAAKRALKGLKRQMGKAMASGLKPLESADS